MFNDRKKSLEATKINLRYGPFRQGDTIDIWAYIAKDSISACESVLKCYTIILYMYSEELGIKDF